jgi:opacity protein-like surface antigen
MRLRLFPPTSLAVLLVFSAHPIFAQVAPAGVVHTLPINVGVGFSNYDTDISYGTGSSPARLSGGTFWLGYDPTFLPGKLGGLGIEAQARDLNFGHSSSQPFLRQDTAAGGVIYHWERHFLFRPYGEFLMGYGNADYRTPTGIHYHQTRTITTVGGGAEFDTFHRLWVRAEYEYQWWPDFFITGDSQAGKDSAGIMNPQGVTVGVSYHFNQGYSR